MTEPTLTRPELIGAHPTMARVREMIRRYAPHEQPVLLVGESGTGKDLIARLLHTDGPRAAAPFVAVACTALPCDLFGAQMFGAMRGSYTGAMADQPGLFEAAGDGTLLLDDVATLPVELQAMLLRALEAREGRRLGAATPYRINARIVATMNESPDVLRHAGRLRDDFYYRLAVLRIDVPPLRERRADIPALIDHTLARLNATLPRPVVCSVEAYAQCACYWWPGNVRELAHAIEVAAIACLAEHGVIEPPHLPEVVRGGLTAADVPPVPDVRVPGFSLMSALRQIEVTLIVQALQHGGGVVAHAARLLRMKRGTLVAKIRQHRKAGRMTAPQTAVVPLPGGTA